MQEKKYRVTGMSCAACQLRVEKAASAVPGVAACTVNLLKNEISVEEEDSLEFARLKEAVENAGYGLEEAGSEDVFDEAASRRREEALDDELREKRRSLLIAAAFLIPLFYLSMGPMAGLPGPAALEGPGNVVALAFTELLLTLPILYLFRAQFVNGVKTLVHRAPTMDALVALGAGASVVSGVAALVVHGFVSPDPSALAGSLYFEGAGMILTLVNLGKYFEARAKRRTTDAVEALVAMAPKEAVVLVDGVEQTVPVARITSGMTVVLKAGAHVPVDGVGLSGSAELDESMLTGESRPVKRGPDETLACGTLVLSGRLLMRATRVGGDTTLSKIVEWVDKATSRKAPVSRLADRVSGIFVPVVIAIALVTFIVWWLLGAGVGFAASAAIAVLVVSCPCALGLATPTAIMVGTGRAATLGVLFKSAAALEALARVKTVVFDKTGTLTNGRPSLDAVHPAQGGPVDATDLLVLAASVEAASDHPLARAVTTAASGKNLPLLPIVPGSFTQVEGLGLTGSLEGIGRVEVGNEGFVEKGAGVVPADVMDAVLAARRRGSTPLMVWVAGTFAGWLDVRDTAREGALETVRWLSEHHREVVMLTGDDRETALELARRVGIRPENVHAGVRPEGKARVIEEQKARGPVAMTGDGVNDAPALALADVGIAVGTGTDVAAGSADVVLLSGSPLDVVRAVGLSEATLRNIHQNLFWAFIYNAVGIPVAAGVLHHWTGWMLSPMLAAAMMSCSSVSVVTNALRLRFVTPEVPFAASLLERDSHVEPASGPGVEKACPVGADETEGGPSPDLADAGVPEAPDFVLEVDEMSCPHCVRAVEKAARSVAGVASARVDLEAGRAFVVLDPDVVGSDQKRAAAIDAVIAAVVEDGYPARLAETAQTSVGSGFTLEMTGLSCPHCVRAVKKALEGVDGVVSAEVTLGTDGAPSTAVVRTRAGSGVERSALVKAVEEDGYGVL